MRSPEIGQHARGFQCPMVNRLVETWAIRYFTRFPGPFQDISQPPVRDAADGGGRGGPSGRFWRKSLAQVGTLGKRVSLSVKPKDLQRKWLVMDRGITSEDVVLIHDLQ
jgi:hypothetical protein